MVTPVFYITIVFGILAYYFMSFVIKHLFSSSTTYTFLSFQIGAMLWTYLLKLITPNFYFIFLYDSRSGTSAMCIQGLIVVCILIQ